MSGSSAAARQTELENVDWMYFTVTQPWEMETVGIGQLLSKYIEKVFTIEFLKA